MGETTVTMGDTVSLYCNASHSRPPATVQWLSPGGEVVSDGGVLEIFNFTWKLEGLYTCVASFVNSSVTKNSSVQVTIRCDCLSVPVKPLSNLFIFQSTLHNLDQRIVLQLNYLINHNHLWRFSMSPLELCVLNVSLMESWLLMPCSR